MKLDPATLHVVRDWLQIARLGVVIVFVVLGLRIVRRTEPAARRRAVNHLLLYLVALHLFLAAAQTDAWPFSNYPMMTADLGDHPRTQEMPVFRAVDGRGTEWQIDPNCWSPLYPQNMAAWMDVVGPKLTAAERQNALRYLLRRAEEARRRRAAGERYIGNNSLLGPAAAPDIDLLPGVAPAPLPFRGLRLYMQSWTPAELAADRSHVRRRLIEEVSDKVQE